MPAPLLALTFSDALAEGNWPLVGTILSVRTQHTSDAAGLDTDARSFSLGDAELPDEKGLDFSKPLIFWRARQDLNPRPLGS